METQATQMVSLPWDSVALKPSASVAQRMGPYSEVATAICTSDVQIVHNDVAKVVAPVAISHMQVKEQYGCSLLTGAALEASPLLHYPPLISKHGICISLPA